jgi:hypothetical protein
VSGRQRDPHPVVPLRQSGSPEGPRPPTTRPGRLHALATATMTVAAVVGILATIAFITVTWPGRLGHYVVAAILFSAIAFVASASIAVIAAARDTYTRRPLRRHGDEPPE